MIRVSLTRVCTAAAVALVSLVSSEDGRANGPAREPIRTPAASAARQASHRHEAVESRPAAAACADTEELFPSATAALDLEGLADCREDYDFCLEFSPPSACLPAYQRCVRACRR